MEGLEFKCVNRKDRAVLVSEFRKHAGNTNLRSNIFSGEDFTSTLKMVSSTSQLIVPILFLGKSMFGQRFSNAITWIAQTVRTTGKENVD